MIQPKLCCPHCHAFDSRVIRSTQDTHGLAFLRRRECLACGQRFTTTEQIIGAYKKPSSSSTAHQM